MNQVQESDTGDLLNKGNQFFGQGSYESAIQEYIKVMQTKPERYQQFCERGMHFAQLGGDQDAIHHFIQQQKITLKDLAQYLKGMASYYTLQYEDAFLNFSQTIHRCPQFKNCFYDRDFKLRLLNNASSYHDLGSISYQYGRKKEAIPHFKGNNPYYQISMSYIHYSVSSQYAQGLSINKVSTIIHQFSLILYLQHQKNILIHMIM